MSKISQPTISRSPPLHLSNPHPWGLSYSSWINEPQKNNHHQPTRIYQLLMTTYPGLPFRLALYIFMKCWVHYHYSLLRRNTTLKIKNFINSTVHKPETLHKFKVRKLKTLCQLASLQTSQLQRPEFAFLYLFQCLEVPELILEEKLCWPRGIQVGFHNFGFHNWLWICVRFLCATRF